MNNFRRVAVFVNANGFSVTSQEDPSCAQEVRVFKSKLELYNWLDDNLKTPSDWKYTEGGKNNGNEDKKEDCCEEETD